MSDVDNLPFEQLRAEWLAHGLSTEPADFDAAERMIADLYSRVGLRSPSRFVRVASPPAGLRQLTEYEAEHGLPEPVFVPSTGWQQEYHETRGQIHRAEREALDDRAVGRLETTTGDPRPPLRGAVAPPQRMRHRGRARPAVEDTIHRWSGSCMWGQHEAAHFCYYSGMALLGVDVSAWRPHIDIATMCGWWWGLDDPVVMVDRPAEIGAAIGFRNDWAATCL